MNVPLPRRSPRLAKMELERARDRLEAAHANFTFWKQKLARLNEVIRANPANFVSCYDKHFDSDTFYARAYARYCAYAAHKARAAAWRDAHFAVRFARKIGLLSQMTDPIWYDELAMN